MTRKQTLIARLNRIYKDDPDLAVSLSRMNSNDIKAHLEAWRHRRKWWRMTLDAAKRGKLV